MKTCIAWNVVLAVATAGCGAAAVDPEFVGDEDFELVGNNALNPNALSPNALSPNALSPNALSPNALSPNALSPSALAAITDPGDAGSLSRQFLRYAVGCALDGTQSFSFTWTDSKGGLHPEMYPGLLGIEPTWATGPLSLNGQEMVSACLAGRTNWYEVSVIISMRSLQSPLRTLVAAEELAAYPDIEGGFWGNLFTASPYVRACYLDSTVANSRAYLRDCAAGHLNPNQTISTCGMLAILGSCTTHCNLLNAQGQFYPDCTDPVHGMSLNIVTTALP
jgi:hypothetical protein